MEKLIDELKGIPLSKEEILSLKDSVPEGQSSINYNIYDKIPPVEGKSKTSYELQFSFYKRTGRQASTFSPDSKSQIYLFIVDSKGKVVVKKKLKANKYINKGLKGRIATGTYLVITWCDLGKEQRVGNVYYWTK